jgi:DNA (cytosine-5)-methyltransferase 1
VSLVLSLFPGIGLLDMAFEEEGFCVVRGPDLLWGGDVRRFHPPAGRFNGVIGGPPCQIFSRLRFVNPKAGQKHGNLIPEFERVVDEARPDWFLMENVEGAPVPCVRDFFPQTQIVRDVWVGGVTDRKRRFTFAARSPYARFDVQWDALHQVEPEHSALAGGGGRPVPVALERDGKGGHRSKKSALKNYGYTSNSVLVEHCRLQGLPATFLGEAPFTVSGKIHAIGNGVPLPMGRAIARAVKQALAR